MTRRDMTHSDVPDDDTSGTGVSGGTGQAVGSDGAFAADATGTSGTSDGGVAAEGNGGLSTALARVTDEDLAPQERRNAVAQLAAALRRHGFSDLFKPKSMLSWLSDTVVDIAPRIPLRPLPTLRSHHPGLSDEEIADRIVKHAARATASIGAIGGGITSMEWVAPPALLTAPAVLAAETVAVVAVEIKMLGELQELYGLPVPGGSTQRAASLVQAWAHRRGVNLLVPGRAMTAVLGTAARHELRDRLIRRFGRNLTSLGPLLTGAAVAAFLNRRATLRLAEEVREDLSRTRSGAH